MRIKKKLGLDLDSCLNNLEEKWLSDYNKDYNDNLTPEDLLTWDTYKYVKPECGIKIYDYLVQPGYFRNLEPKFYTEEVVQWLSEYFELYIVTAYKAHTCMDKVGFIKEYYPCIKEENIIFLNDKGLITLDYLVDDGPHNIEAFQGQGIVMDMAYNRYLGEKYPRMNDYLDVEAYFYNILKQEQVL